MNAIASLYINCVFINLLSFYAIGDKFLPVGQRTDAIDAKN